MPLISYCPEMGDKTPNGDIEASMCHGAEHWHLYTPLTLKGRGVEHRGTCEEVAPWSSSHPVNHRRGWNRYRVTNRAFDLICLFHNVICERSLD